MARDYEDDFRAIIDHSLLYSKFDRIAQKAYQEGVTAGIRLDVAQARKEGYRAGIEAAAEVANSQEGCHEGTGSAGERGHDNACQIIEYRIRALLTAQNPVDGSRLLAVVSAAEDLRPFEDCITGHNNPTMSGLYRLFRAIDAYREGGKENG